MTGAVDAGGDVETASLHPNRRHLLVGGVDTVARIFDLEALLPAGGGALPRALPAYGSEAALSISRALCASLAAAKGAAARGGEGAAAAAALVAAQEKRLFALTEELCLRLSLAAAGDRKSVV